MALYFATRGLLAPVMDADIKRQMAEVLRRNPGLTEDKIQGGFEFGRKFAGLIIVLASAVLPLLTGFFAWLVGKIVGSVAALGDMIMIATFAAFPRLLQFASTAFQVVVMPEEKIRGQLSVSLGVGTFPRPRPYQPPPAGAPGPG